MVADKQGQDALAVRGILENAVAGFKPNSPLADLLSGVAEKVPAEGKTSFH